MKNKDVSLILAAQGLRAASYGFTSVLLGALLGRQGRSETEVGILLTAIVAGNALTSLVVGRYGDRIGRRRLYAVLFVGLAASGLVFGLIDRFGALILVALAGTMSTEVVESGPFTSLEQAMLPALDERPGRRRIFGTYNAVATLAGSAGALAAGAPAILRQLFPATPQDRLFFLVLVPAGLVGAILALSLSDLAEVGRNPGRGGALQRSRKNVLRLSGLFALDSFAGGFVIQTFIAYWFVRRFGTSSEALGIVFFFVGLLQSGSFLVATRLAERIGILKTMVTSHLASNLLLALIPLAPVPSVAIALLLGRFALSQMDVPTRQAYVMALVDPEERTTASAYTNSARYLVRPLGPVLAGMAQQVTLGLPFFIGGGLKAVYDLTIWAWFRKVPLAESSVEEQTQAHDEHPNG